MTTKKLPVIFKIETWQGVDTPIAVFPTIKADFNHNIQIYSRIGQHSGAHPEYISQCKISDEKKCVELYNELKKIYSDIELKPMKRSPKYQPKKYIYE